MKPRAHVGVLVNDGHPPTYLTYLELWHGWPTVERTKDESKEYRARGVKPSGESSFSKACV